MSFENAPPASAPPNSLQKTVAELQWLNHLAQKIISAPNVEAALDEVVAEASQYLSADGASLMLVNPPHPGTEITRTHQMLTLARQGQGKSDERFRQLSRNISGWILKHKSWLASQNLARDERFSGMALFGNANYGAAGVPILTEEKIIGTFIVFKIETFERAQEAAEVMQRIAAQVAPTLEKLYRLQALAEENRFYKQSLIAQHGITGIVAKSEAMKKIFTLLERVTDSDVRVLIEGESGTGKELIARTLHFNGVRREKKFMAVDCGAIPENLLESELFGYVKGAFTGATQNRKGLFQEAEGGTLFLDEINNLPLSLQAKLMRVLQEGEVRPLGSNTTQKVDVRVLVASSRSLAELVKAGKFREDLYFRLKVVTLRLPPLRERSGDIPLLANHFLKKYAGQYQKPVIALDSAAMKLMQTYPWPGNVRELEHAVEQAVVLASPAINVLTVSDLPEEIRLGETKPAVALEQMSDLAAAVEALEMRMIRRALAETNGNKSRAAERLGLSRRGLLNKLERYGIELEEKTG